MHSVQDGQVIQDKDGKNLRRLPFDQEHAWNPTVMANGRVMFTRWEYADKPLWRAQGLWTVLTVCREARKIRRFEIHVGGRGVVDLPDHFAG